MHQNISNISKDICECYFRADECRGLAENAMSESVRADFFAMEQRWLALARSYEFTKRLSSLNEGSRRVTAARR